MLDNASQSKAHPCADPHRASRVSTLAVLCLGLSTFWGAASISLGQERRDTRDFVAERSPADGQASATWVVAIGVDGYDKAPPLKFCKDDAEALVQTLVHRSGVERGQNCLVMTEKSPPELRPTRANIVTQVPEFLKRARPGDTVIVFFSGHGFRDKESTFLAPLDCDPEHVGLSGVAVAAVRKDLVSCRASAKLLIIDACHAGNVKGNSEIGITARDLQKDLEGAVGVYTIASCQANEKSVIWDDKQHGVFTYWLGRGLEGAADDNGDGAISADELFQFVRAQVPGTARRLGFRQTPVRIAEANPAGVPTLARLKPEPVTAALERIAELVHEQVLARSVRRIGIPEFASLAGNREELGRLGPFGRIAADRIERHLVSLSSGNYSVVDQRQLTAAIKDFRVEDLANPQSLGQLPQRLSGLEAILTGTFVSLPDPERLRLNCKLLRLPSGDVLASLSGMITIDQEFWPILGGSVDVTQLPPPAPGRPSPVVMMNQEAQRPHPLLRPDFPYRVEIRSGGKPKQFYQRGPNELFVSARPEEEYQIFIANNTDQDLFVRVFIDGLNVLGARRELPEEAWPWHFPPRSSLAIDSWHRPQEPDAGRGLTPNEQVFAGGKFVFVEPARSLAARQGFGEDIGQITVVFYTAAASRGPLGTDERGNVVKQYPTPRGDLSIGSMLASVTVRYVRDEVLEHKR